MNKDLGVQVATSMFQVKTENMELKPSLLTHL